MTLSTRTRSLQGRIVPVLVCLLAVPAMQARAAAAATVDELVAKNLAARGGNDALHAMQSLRVHGRLLINDGQVELAYVQTIRRPASVRTEAAIQGMTLVQAFDGTGGWQINPFMGRRTPEHMSADDIKLMAEAAADFDGPLVDAALKGNKLEYLGIEDVDGTPAHKIRLTRPNGDVEYVYLDPDYYLEIRLLSQRTEHGAKVETETDLGEYMKVDGVYIPFSVESVRKGTSDRQKLLLDKAELNVASDASVFAFPAAPAKSGK